MIKEKNNTSENQFVAVHGLRTYSSSNIDILKRKLRELRNLHFGSGSKYFPFEAGIYERIKKEELERGWILQDIEKMEEYEKRIDKSIKKFEIFPNFTGGVDYYGSDNFKEIITMQKIHQFDDDRLYKLVAFEKHSKPEKKQSFIKGANFVMFLDLTPETPADGGK
ncbi:MAG: hypothetical protein ISS95_00200 [Candidatus Aenigmarchaeota archaeon]|nr:hypothetical protein [Candidatus Aenigmarchaeota archaeon]